MKTSNKLLIAFASAMILIPLLGMIYVSQVNYKVGDYRSEQSNKSATEKHFNLPTENMESRVIPTAFTSINIEDAKRLGLYLIFAEDEHYGVKLPKAFKDSINFTVDAAGKLQFKFNVKRAANDNRYITLIVYGKGLKQVNISNVEFMYFDAVADSLQLNVKKSGNITLNKDITANALQITTDDVKRVELIQLAVKSLQVYMNGGEFKTSGTSYDNVSITTTGKSAIEVYGTAESYGEQNNDNYRIKNLFIKTLNVADVKLENIKVEKCSGSFSDETKVQMPAVNLNQMYKK